MLILVLSLTLRFPAIVIESQHKSRLQDNPRMASSEASPVGVKVNDLETLQKESDYYEKGGLRTYGDGEDHDHEPPVPLILSVVNS